MSGPIGDTARRAYIVGMTRLAASLLALALAASPAAAAADEEGGTSLMEEGARLFFRGLMEEMEPALRELEGLAEEMEPALRNFATEMGPKLRQLMREVEDWSVYEAPEILPNGDIIIRRKPDAPEWPPEPDASGPEETGEIEL